MLAQEKVAAKKASLLFINHEAREAKVGCNIDDDDEEEEEVENDQEDTTDYLLDPC